MKTETADSPSIATAPAIATVAPTEAAAAPAPGQADASQPSAVTPPAGAAETGNTTPPPKPGRTVSDMLGLPATEREADDDAVAEDTVLLSYQLVLQGGREEVLRIKSQLILPLALEVENLAQTDVSFPELFDRVITRPVVTKFRSFLQRRFDAASRAEAEAKAAAETPAAPTNVGIRSPKPTNGASYVLPQVDTLAPLPKPPGWSSNTTRQ